MTTYTEIKFAPEIKGKQCPECGGSLVRHSEQAYCDWCQSNVRPIAERDSPRLSRHQPTAVQHSPKWEHYCHLLDAPGGNLSPDEWADWTQLSQEFGDRYSPSGSGYTRWALETSHPMYGSSMAKRVCADYPPPRLADKRLTDDVIGEQRQGSELETLLERGPDGQSPREWYECLERVRQESEGEVPFDFGDLIPVWTYIPACGHKVLYRIRLTVNTWGFCRECQAPFQVSRKTVEIPARTGQLAMRPGPRSWSVWPQPRGEAMRDLSRAVDDGIIRNRIAHCLWESGYRDNGAGEVPKETAKRIAGEVGRPEKSWMVPEVAAAGIVRVRPGELAPYPFKGRVTIVPFLGTVLRRLNSDTDPAAPAWHKTSRQADKAAGVWKKMVDEDSAGFRFPEDTGWDSGWDPRGWLVPVGRLYWPNGFRDFWLERGTVLDTVAGIRAHGRITYLPRPARSRDGVVVPPKRPTLAPARPTFWGTEPDVRRDTPDRVTELSRPSSQAANLRWPTRVPKVAESRHIYSLAPL